MTTKAILVLGAESSGNRLMLRLLYAAGCAGNLHEDNTQDFDRRIPPASDMRQPIAWLRSFPHAQQYPNLQNEIDDLFYLGYVNVKAVVMIRDWFPMLDSQVSIGHCKTHEEAAQRSMNGLSLIFNDLYDRAIPFCVITYAGLVHHTQPVLTRLTRSLGLQMPLDFEAITDSDEKWYADSCSV